MRSSGDWAGTNAYDDLLQEEGRGRKPLTLEELCSVDSDGEGEFFVDGELYRTTLSLRRGLEANL